MFSKVSISAILALALAQVASAQDTTTIAPTTTAAPKKKEFPLVWVCLGITIVGVIIALYVAYRRPDELHLPGSTVMTSTEKQVDGEAPAYNNATKDADYGMQVV